MKRNIILYLYFYVRFYRKLKNIVLHGILIMIDGTNFVELSTTIKT